MRRAAKLLSTLLALSMCLTINTFASAGCAVPLRADSGALLEHTPAPVSDGAPTPDPLPPVENEPDPASSAVDAGSFPASGHTSLTGFPSRTPDLPIAIGTEAAGSQDVRLNENVTGDGYTSVYALGAEADVRVTGSARLSDASAGENACYPSGRGAALAAHDGAHMTVTEASIATDGVSRTGLIVSDGANATVQDAEFTALGGQTVSGGEGYVNTPDPSRMTSPPWGLGIAGRSRAMGLIGLAPGLSLVRSDVSADGWGLLSSSCSENASITAVDSDLRILPAGSGGMDSGWQMLGFGEDAYGSGYGSYLTGGASQYFYGSSVTGATYGAVLDGADQVYFGSSKGTVLLYDGIRLAGSVRGQGRNSSIDSVFGLMMCGDVTDVTVSDGTSLHTADAAVLCKDGSGSFSFNNARVESDTGVLFQMMDNDDDDRIGLLAGTYGCSPVYDDRDADPSSGFPGMDQAAPAGSPSTPDKSDGSDTSDATPPMESTPQSVTLSYANGLYTGSIYNGTGYYGQPGDSLTVSVDEGAVLNGDISLTSTVKAIPCSAAALAALEACGEDVAYAFLDSAGVPCQKDQAAYIRLMRYTIDQYFLQGHVQNLPFYNGAVAVDVTVARGGSWIVQDVSTVTSLTVEEGALVYGQVEDNADGSITLHPAAEPLEPGVYASALEAFAPETAAGQDDDAPDGTEGNPAASPAPAGDSSGRRGAPLDLYTFDGEEYLKLTDLLLLFFRNMGSPGI